jgi:broad specificity phosphatase PhoE
MSMAPTGPLYLLRHGETIWNRAKRLQGHKDTPLTLRGVQQAEAMGKALARELDGMTPALFFASPLDRLKEVTFGIWDGLNIEQLRADHSETWQRRLDDKWRFVPPGGESYMQVADRVGDFLTYLPAQRPLVVVAHGAHNRVFRGLWRGLEPAEFLALDEPQDGFYRLNPVGFEDFIQA